MTDSDGESTPSDIISNEPLLLRFAERSSSTLRNCFRFGETCSDETLRQFYLSLSVRQLRTMFKLYLKQVHEHQSVAQKNLNLFKNYNDKKMKAKGNQVRLKQYNHACEDLLASEGIEESFLSHFNSEQLRDDLCSSEIVKKCPNPAVWSVVFSFLSNSQRVTCMRVCRYFAKSANKPTACSHVELNHRLALALSSGQVSPKFFRFATSMRMRMRLYTMSKELAAVWSSFEQIRHLDLSLDENSSISACALSWQSPMLPITNAMLSSVRSVGCSSQIKTWNATPAEITNMRAEMVQNTLNILSAFSHLERVSLREGYQFVSWAFRVHEIFDVCPNIRDLTFHEYENLPIAAADIPLLTKPDSTFDRIDKLDLWICPGVLVAVACKFKAVVELTLHNQIDAAFPFEVFERLEKLELLSTHDIPVLQHVVSFKNIRNLSFRLNHTGDGFLASDCDCGHLSNFSIFFDRLTNGFNYFVDKIVPALEAAGNLKSFTLNVRADVSQDAQTRIVQMLSRLSTCTFKRDLKRPEQWVATNSLERFELKMSLTPEQQLFLSVWFPSVKHGPMLHQWYWHDDVFLKLWPPV